MISAIFVVCLFTLVAAPAPASALAFVSGSVVAMTTGCIVVTVILALATSVWAMIVTAHSLLVWFGPRLRI